MSHLEREDPQAYICMVDGEHIICPECPDKDYAETLVANLEWRLTIDRIINGEADYIKRGIHHIICDACKAKHSADNPTHHHGKK